MKLALFAERSLEALFTEARAAGYTTVRASLGYVSYNDRAELFDGYLSAERNFSSRNYAATGKRFSDRAYAVLGSTYLNENYVSKDSYTLSLADARRVVLSYCDEPGSDEHQSGLAVDLCDISPSAGDFASSPFAAWLKENAHKFGFVIRYPADKTAETGHAAEPWHLRYVGRYHAAAMHASANALRNTPQGYRLPPRRPGREDNERLTCRDRHTDRRDRRERNIFRRSRTGKQKMPHARLTAAFQRAFCIRSIRMRSDIRSRGRPEASAFPHPAFLRQPPSGYSFL